MTWEAVIDRMNAAGIPGDPFTVIRHGDYRPWWQPFPVPVVDGRPQYSEADKEQLRAEGWTEWEDGFFYKAPPSARPRCSERKFTGP